MSSRYRYAPEYRKYIDARNDYCKLCKEKIWAGVFIQHFKCDHKKAAEDWDRLNHQTTTTTPQQAPCPPSDYNQQGYGAPLGIGFNVDPSYPPPSSQPQFSQGSLLSGPGMMAAAAQLQISHSKQQHPPPQFPQIPVHLQQPPPFGPPPPSIHGQPSFDPDPAMAAAAHQPALIEMLRRQSSRESGSGDGGGPTSTTLAGLMTTTMGGTTSTTNPLLFSGITSVSGNSSNASQNPQSHPSQFPMTLVTSFAGTQQQLAPPPPYSQMHHSSATGGMPQMVTAMGPSNPALGSGQPFGSGNDALRTQHQQSSYLPTGPKYYSSPSFPTVAPTQTMATPSILPNPDFNAQQTAELLRTAMVGFGCDNRKVIQALVNCSNAQRREVARVFMQKYCRDLISNLKSGLGGDFEDFVMALMQHPARYDAAQLHRAMEGIGTKEHVLIEIMTTRSNAAIHQIKAEYRDMYHGDLERDLIGETSGYFKLLLIALCSGARDESWQTDQVRANQDALKLYRAAGEGRFGIDESTFMSVLSLQSYAQLRLVFSEYQKVSGHSIEQAVCNEFSGDIKDGLVAIVKSIQNRAAYFAELLYISMRGFGTSDTDLIRLVVTRSEIDMSDIRQAYQHLYGGSLEQAIASDCSGAYKQGLCAIVIVKGFYD